MIGYLSGQVAYSKGPKSIVKTDMGIGYEIRTPREFLVDEQVELFIYHSISENDQSLWGFQTTGELEIFKLLLTVNKVGPSKAYPLVMTLGVDAFTRGVVQEDIALLTKSPGIGKKMAEQIILSLKDKVQDYILAKPSAITTNTLGIDSAHSNFDINDIVIKDTISALESLGYKDRDVLPLVKKYFDSNFTQSEDLLKVILREL